MFSLWWNHNCGNFLRYPFEEILNPKFFLSEDNLTLHCKTFYYSIHVFMAPLYSQLCMVLLMVLKCNTTVLCSICSFHDVSCNAIICGNIRNLRVVIDEIFWFLSCLKLGHCDQSSLTDLFLVQLLHQLARHWFLVSIFMKFGHLYIFS